MKFYASKPEDPPRSARPDWKDKKLQSPPATKSNVLSPKAGQDLILLSRAAVLFMQALNPGRGELMKGQNSNWTALTIPSTGQFNQSSETWWADGATPKFETVGYVWNIYAGFPEDKTFSGYVKLATVNHSAPMPDPLLHNWHTEPWLYHVMTSISTNGSQFRIGQAFSLFIPIFSKSSDKPLYHNLSDLEPFPDLPMQVTVSPPKKGDTLKVYAEPSESSLVAYSLNTGDIVTINEYAPRGNHIWASIVDKDHSELVRWICLRHETNYYTAEWRLTTPSVHTPVKVFPLEKKAQEFQTYGWAKIPKVKPKPGGDGKNNKNIGGGK